MSYILVLISNVFLAFDFALNKKYQSGEGNTLIPSLKFNVCNGLFTALIFFLMVGLRPQFSLFSLVMAFLMASCCVGYSVLGFRILRQGNIASYTLFLMSGGMLLPYLFGVLFLDEALTLPRVAGVLVILGAVVLSGSPKSRLSHSQLLLCVAVFVLNGCVSIISKCHQVNTTFSVVDSTAFVMYSGIGKCTVSALALALCRPARDQLSFRGKLTPGLILCSAVAGGLSYMFQLIGAKDLPATVLYPLITGGCIVFSALSGKIFFRETITKAQWVSIALCVLGTLAFL